MSTISLDLGPGSSWPALSNTTDAQEILNSNITEIPPPENATTFFPVAGVIKFYSNLFILPLGLATNIINFGVFFRSDMLRMSTGRYLLALSAADFTLVFGRFMWWLGDSDFPWGNYIGIYSATCMISLYCVYCGQYFSSWLTVSITIERFVAIVFPLHVSRIATPFIANRIIFTLLFLSAILSVHPYFTLDSLVSVEFCYITNFFIYNIFDYIYVTLTLVVPSVVVAVFTGLILINLSKVKKQWKSQLNDDVQQKRKMAEKRLSIVLMSIAVAFLVLRFPYLLLYYMARYGSAIWGIDIIMRMKIAREISKPVSSLNFSINFFFYLFLGQAFIKDLRACFGCKNEEEQKNISLTGGTSNMSISRISEK